MKKVFLIIFITLFLSFCNKDGEWEDPTKPKKGTSGEQCSLLYLYCESQKQSCLLDGVGDCGYKYYVCVTNLVIGCVKDQK